MATDVLCLDCATVECDGSTLDCPCGHSCHGGEDEATPTVPRLLPPEEEARLASELEARGAWHEASLAWKRAAGASLGHRRAEGYEARARECANEATRVFLRELRDQLVGMNPKAPAAKAISAEIRRREKTLRDAPNTVRVQCTKCDRSELVASASALRDACGNCGGSWHVINRRTGAPFVRGQCEFCGADDEQLVGRLEADPDQKVCLTCHADSRIPTQHNE